MLIEPIFSHYISPFIPLTITHAPIQPPSIPLTRCLHLTIKKPLSEVVVHEKILKKALVFLYHSQSLRLEESWRPDGFCDEVGQ